MPEDEHGRRRGFSVRKGLGRSIREYVERDEEREHREQEGDAQRDEAPAREPNEEEPRER